MVTGGRVRLADGGMVDISTGDTFDWKQSLWFGNSKVKLVCAPKMQKDGGKKKTQYYDLFFCLIIDINTGKTKFFLKISFIFLGMRIKT